MTAIAKSRAVLSCVIAGTEGALGTAVYSQTFSASTDSWAGVAGTTVTNPTVLGGKLLRLSGTGSAAATRTITGLTVGAWYRFNGSASNNNSGGLIIGVISVDGKPGTGRTFTLGSLLHEQDAYFTFQATATSHTFRLAGTFYSSGTRDIDFSLAEVRPVTDMPLAEPISAEISLDDAHAPYATATIVIPIPDQTYLAAMDPRNQPRVQLAAAITWDEPTTTAQSRFFDLVIHEREVDHVAGTVTLTAQSDEALLIDRGNVLSTAILDAISYANLRDIVNLILARYSSILEASPSNDYTLNLVTPNPGGETGVTTGWTAVSATSSLSVSSAQAYAGSNSIACTATGTGNLGMLLGTASSGTSAGVAVTAGVSYTATMQARVSVARTATLTLRFFNSSGVQVGSDVTSSGVALLTTAWSSLTVTAIAPVGAVKGYFFIAAASAVSTNVLYCDAMVLLPTAISADMFLQQPGIKDWDFITPLLTVAGLRLFCDEGRLWRLADTTYTPGGTITLDDAVNITDATDIISLEATRDDGSPLWFSGCVVKYDWTDSKTNAQMVAYDVAGTVTSVYLIEIAAPYPGPGAAAKYLAAATSRGRVQSIKALASLNASPGMTLNTSLPETHDQTGKIAGVTWAWSSEGEDHDTMTVRARDLVDA